MKFVLLWVTILVLAESGPPNFNVYEPPETSFTCQGKVVGGYYADPEASCQLFHICVQLDENQVQDFRFLCPNDTLFDQENFVCADWRDVDCAEAIHYYDKNLDLFKPTEEEVEHALQQQNQDALRRKRQLFEAPLAPTEEMAQTNFSCNNRSGYFADFETNCITFHICLQDDDGHSMYQCLNGTVFDQKRLFCRPQFQVNCSQDLNGHAPNKLQLDSIHLKLDSSINFDNTTYPLYGTMNQSQSEEDDDSWVPYNTNVSQISLFK